MDFNKLRERTTLILTTPKTEWHAIASERTSTTELYLGYILILSAIVPVASFIKISILGIHIPMVGTYRVGIGSGFGNMVLNYAFSLAGVYIMAMIIDTLAPSFGGSKDRTQALKTAAYSYTASWVAGVLILIPWIGMPLLLAGSLYSIYLLYLGLPIMMKCPREKAVGYTAITVLIAVVISFAISTVVGGITGTRMQNGGRHDTLHNSGAFEKKSLGGKLENWSNKMEQAEKEVEQANKSGDEEAQKKAVGKMMATALGNDGTVETLAPDRIKTFLPETLAGKTRINISAERSGAMGFQISSAEAAYKDADGNFKVKITDMGAAKTVMAVAGWADVQKETSNATGFEKTYRDGSQIIHEKWDIPSRTGEFDVIVGGRFSVDVSGKAADISGLKKFADSMNLAGLAALKDEGVKK